MFKKMNTKFCAAYKKTVNGMNLGLHYRSTTFLNAIIATKS